LLYSINYIIVIIDMASSDPVVIPGEVRLILGTYQHHETPAIDDHHHQFAY
jgi:hypothetical protein